MPITSAARPYEYKTGRFSADLERKWEKTSS